MSDPKKRLLQALEASRKVQGILDDVSREERRPKPLVEANETGQSSHSSEASPSKSVAAEPSEPA